MMAINNAYAEIDDDTFIDPYAENIEGYTNDTLREALKRIEDRIISANIPS